MEFLGVVLIFQKLALMLILKVSNSRIQSYFHCFVPSDADKPFQGPKYFFSLPDTLAHHFPQFSSPCTMYLFMHIT